MRKGDYYNHYKNKAYYFDCIALPLTTLSEKDKMVTKPIGTARYHEDTHDLTLYEKDGVIFIDAPDPHVIYQTEADRLFNPSFVYAREVDDFFGYKEMPDHTFVKRFTLKEDQR